jgi:dihydroorotate dehydrogenase electron transfer subunit
VIRRQLAPVLALDALYAPGHFVLTLDSPELARDARPGSFVGALTETGGERMLRKPFSVFTVDPERGVVQILFSVYGPTTKAMSQLRPGETLDLLGPLGGRLFAPDTRRGVHHVMVGGGYGVPPLNFLAREIRKADPTTACASETSSSFRAPTTEAEASRARSPSR